MSACMTSKKRLQRRLPRWWKFQFSFLLSFKNIDVCNPHPLTISMDLSWGGYGYFLELHILTFNWSPQTFVHNSQNAVSNQTNHQIIITDADCHDIYLWKCLGLYCTWRQSHPGDDNLHSCYVIFLLDNDVSRKIKTLIASEIQHGTGLYCTWRQNHPGDDNLYSYYVIFLLDSDVSRRNKTSIASEIQHGTGSLKSPQ